MKSVARPLVACATLLAALAASSSATANQPGPPGYTGKPNPQYPGGDGCGRCHSGGPTPQVALTGPDTVAVGALANYSLRVSASGGTLRCMVSATAGVDLTPTSGTLVKSFDELTPSTGAGGTCSFQLKAAAAGNITIYYAGASTNGNGTGGDGFAKATKVVTVTGGTPRPDAGPPIVDAGSPPDGAAPPRVDGGTAGPSVDGGGVLPDGAVAPGGQSPASLTPTDADGGCSAAASPGAPISLWGLVWSAVVAGALLVSRRRRR